MAHQGTAQSLKRLFRRNRENVFHKMLNPYTFGVPVRGKGFFGREEELQRIFDTLENVPRGQKQDMVVLGPRRIGKSSLLYRLTELLTEHPDFAPVYIDVQNVKPREIRPLFYKILRAIKSSYPSGVLPPFQTQAANIPDDLQYLVFDDDLTELNAVIEMNNLPRLVLMFDEVELLNEFGGRDTLDYFRSLIQKLTYYIFIVAGSDQLYALTQDYGSPFYNIFKTIELFPLTNAAARTVIEEPAAEIGLQIAPAEVDKILTVTGNTPYFIQGIAHYLVEELNQRQRQTATAADVDKILAESVQYLSAQFNYLWNLILLPTKQALLYALAETGSPQTIDYLFDRLPTLHDAMSSRQARQDTFAEFVRQQILTRVSRTRYWFVVPLFVDWIQAKIDDAEILRLASLQPSAEIDKRELVTQLYEQMTRHFNLEELKDLIFTLNIDYEVLPGEGRSGKTRELIIHMERRERLPKLIDKLRELRPDVEWPEFPGN